MGIETQVSPLDSFTVPSIYDFGKIKGIPPEFCTLYNVRQYWAQMCQNWAQVCVRIRHSVNAQVKTCERTVTSSEKLQSHNVSVDTSHIVNHIRAV